MRPQIRRPGFTLVELLVVIGIIALLISILLPTLGRVRESARNLKCLSNLRQFAAANQMYASENRNWAVPGLYRGYNDNGVFANIFWENNVIFKKMLAAQGSRTGANDGNWNANILCPNATGVNTGAAETQSSRSYGMVLSNIDAVGVFGGPPSSLPHYFHGINMSKVRNAAEKALFVDATIVRIEFVQKRAGVTNMGSRTNQTTAPVGDDTAAIPFIKYRHNINSSRSSGTTNIAYFDGHVASVERGDVVFDWVPTSSTPSDYTKMARWFPENSVEQLQVVPGALHRPSHDGSFRLHTTFADPENPSPASHRVAGAKPGALASSGSVHQSLRGLGFRSRRLARALPR
ncbi:MAG TPA: prepilin-type N-terminal cleavage/methylation domain-containing protein [Tepidisphaeraceae bacterium]|nr:prepilin-type N-terminal cleavage/methylation domain-containing protein [Tepidisphaeraceae bacterium]